MSPGRDWPALPATRPTGAPSAFHIMAKPAGAICNLDCRYCYFLSKERLYPGSNFRMAEDLLEAYIRQYLESQAGPEIVLAWQGGEPTLMGLPFFERALDLAERYRPAGATLQHTIQTNGVSLDDDWCAFFRERDVLVGISLDGPRELHDAYRVDKGGAGSFDAVMRGLRRLQRHGVALNVLTTVHAANAAHPLRVYRFLRDEVGAAFLQLIPIVERDNDNGFQEGERVTARSVGAEPYGRFLIEIFDEWVMRDVGRIFVQMFDVALGAWLGQPGLLCVFAPTCGAALALEHNGDLFSCDHFVEPAFKLGNIRETHMIELLASPRQQAFGQAKRDTLPDDCLGCDIRFACHGGCPKDRFLYSTGGSPDLNYLCAGYKAFFRHVQAPMQSMAELLRQGREAAEIMRG